MTDDNNPKPPLIIVDYADMTDTQRRIVDAGEHIAGQFPEGLPADKLAQWITRLIEAANAADDDCGEDISDLTPEEMVKKLSQPRGK